MRRMLAACAALMIAIGLVACGGDDGGNDEDQIRDVAEQLLDNNPDVCSKVTDDFLDRLGGTKEKCEEGAKEEDEKVDAKIDDIDVDGNEATVQLDDDERSELAFVKEDGDWLIDGVSDNSSASTDTSTTTTADSDRDVKARAAADAMIDAIRGGDEAVICGLLDEDYAKQLTKVSDYGIAKCVENLKGKSFGTVGADVTSSSVTLAPDQGSGSVSLSNGKSIDIKWDGSRYVVTDLGGL